MGPARPGARVVYVDLETVAIDGHHQPAERLLHARLIAAAVHQYRIDAGFGRFHVGRALRPIAQAEAAGGSERDDLDVVVRAIDRERELHRSRSPLPESSQRLAPLARGGSAPAQVA